MTNNQIKYGLNIQGVVRVFRKDRQVQSNNGEQFNISDVWFNTSEKEQNGDYFNISTNLIFGRGVEPPVNNSIIQINEAFPTINGKGKYRKIVYFVKNWHYAEQPKQQQQPQGGYNHGGYQQAPPNNGQYQQAPPTQGGYNQQY